MKTYETALLLMFEDSETWPYNDYETFEEFIEMEGPSTAQIEEWLKRQYGDNFREQLSVFMAE